MPTRAWRPQSVNAEINRYYPPGLVAQTYNFWCANNTGTPNTEIDLKVGPNGSKFGVILEDNNSPPNSYKAYSTATITINAGTTGANGLDVGTQTSSTWYYIWVIYNGRTVAGLLSLSSTSPTMPSGYTYSALVGAVFSGGSTHFVAFNQFGKQVWTPSQNVFSNQSCTTAGTLQSQSISTIVPPIAVAFSGSFGSSATVDNPTLTVAGDSTGTGQVQYVVTGVAAGTIEASYAWVVPLPSIPLITRQTFYWTQNIQNASARIDITGWAYP